MDEHNGNIRRESIWILLDVGKTRLRVMNCLREKSKTATEITDELSERKLISKKSYSNTHRILLELKKKGLVDFKKETNMRGKPKIAFLTDDGRSVQTDYEVIKKMKEKTRRFSR